MIFDALKFTFRVAYYLLTISPCLFIHSYKIVECKRYTFGDLTEKQLKCKRCGFVRSNWFEWEK